MKVIVKKAKNGSLWNNRKKTVSHAHNFHGCHQNLQYIEDVTGDEWRMKDGEVFAQKRFHQNYKNMILVITWSSSKQYAKI